MESASPANGPVSPPDNLVEGEVPNESEQWLDLNRRRNAREASAVIQGQLLQYKVLSPHPHKGGGKRGEISDFSPAARLRMIKAFHTINWSEHARPIFITLTYPDHLCRTSKDERNLHRKVMARHLERLTGTTVPAAWRVEWEVRKSGQWRGLPAPHHHWLVFRHRFIHRDDVNALWALTIGATRYVRTETKGLDKSEAAQLYLAKYISKHACPLSLVIGAYGRKLGKQYGWLRQEEIPKYNPVEFARIDNETRRRIAALADEQLPWLVSGVDQSFTLMGRTALDAARILRGERLDE